MEGLQAILSRRSIRKYEERAIEADILENILKAGMFAPSAHNSQPWEFIVIRGRKLMEILSRQPYWAMLKEADTAIVTVANLENYAGSFREFFIQDCSAATENMLLAAHVQGLGGVWLGLYGREEKMAAVRETLNIPKEIIPVSIISLGYPAESKYAHNTFNAEKVHYEKYE